MAQPYVECWGVRGSIPTPLRSEAIADKIQKALEGAQGIALWDKKAVAAYVQSLPLATRGTYGGNTTCLEFRTAEGKTIIIDAGSGIRELGNHLIRHRPEATEIDIFITHDHWDHIQGYPFFVPAWIKGRKLRIHSGAKRSRNSLESSVNPAMEGRSSDTTVTPKSHAKNWTIGMFGGQQNGDYFPITLAEMGADMVFTDFKEGRIIPVGKAEVTYLLHDAHPGGMFSYKIRDAGRVVVSTGDYEHDHVNPRTSKIEVATDERMVNWAQRADLLCYDGHWKPDEYESKREWGHSHYEKGCAIAQKAQVKKLLIMHHAPGRTDTELAQMEEAAQKYMRDVCKSRIPVVFGYEGLRIIPGKK